AASSLPSTRTVVSVMLIANRWKHSSAIVCATARCISGRTCCTPGTACWRRGRRSRFSNSARTTSLVEVALVPFDQVLRGVQLVAVDHRVGQHVLHVLAGLIEGNALHPDVVGQVLGIAQPLAHASGTGVVGRRGEDAIALELVVYLAQIGGAQLDVGLRHQYLLGRGQRNRVAAR